MAVKKRLALFVLDIDHLNRLKKLYPVYFDYYEVVPVYACEIISGQNIDKITFDELRNIEEFREPE